MRESTRTRPTTAPLRPRALALRTRSARSRSRVVLALVAAAVTVGARRAPAQDLPAPAAREDAPVKLPTLEPGASLAVETVTERFELPPAAFRSLAIENGRLRIETREVPLEDVLFVTFPWQPAPPRASTSTTSTEKGGASLSVLLRGGDEIAGAPGDPPDEDAIGLETPLGALRIPLDATRGAVVVDRGAFAPYQQAEEIRRERLRERLRAVDSESDLLVLAEGGTMEGIVERIGRAGVRISTESLGEIDVPYEKLQGFALAAIGGVAPPVANAEIPPNVRITTRDDSVLSGRLGSVKAGQLALEHPRLGKLTLALTEVRALAVLGGRVRFLSDLEPVRTDERLDLALSLELPYRRDRNVLGGPLRLGGQRFRKGLGVHAYSLLEYDLGGEATRFQATIGLDDTAAPVTPSATGTEAEVVFRVRVDGTQRFEKRLTWREAPEEISIDVAGAGRLELEVDYGSGDEGIRLARDRAAWGAARVIRAGGGG